MRRTFLLTLATRSPSPQRPRPKGHSVSLSAQVWGLCRERVLLTRVGSTNLIRLLGTLRALVAAEPLARVLQRTIYPMTRGDNPIEGEAEDLLGRTGLARELEKLLASLPAQEGHVVALTGPWGSGKTSLVNLVKPLLIEGTVLDFNPWMFSGATQLVDSFFRELSAQLSLKDDTKFTKIISAIDDYSSLLTPLAWVPYVGSAFQYWKNLTSATRKLSESSKKSAIEQKARLSEALSALEKPLYVFVDDIDRLHRGEIQDIFKLVRLTANLPNIIYILVYDRDRVEIALSEDGIQGSAFLEKIVQTSIDLPAIPLLTIRRELLRALQDTLDVLGGDGGKFDTERWPDTFEEVILPFFRNMRDVRRYTSSSQLAVTGLRGKVELGDLYALEAIRIFRPDLLAMIARIRATLTTTSSIYTGSEESPTSKAEVEGFLDSCGDKREVGLAVLRRLFPAAVRHIGQTHYGSDFRETWLKQRLVAHRDILDLYLDRNSSPKLTAFDYAEAASALTEDIDSFEAHMRSIPSEYQEDVVVAIGSFDKLSELGVVVCLTTILNLAPELPERQKSMLDPGPRMSVSRTCYRLLSGLASNESREAVTKIVLPQLETISAKYEVFTILVPGEDKEQKLVSEAFAAYLVEAIVEETRVAPSADLAREDNLLRLLYLPTQLGQEPMSLESRQEDYFTIAMIRKACTERIGQTVGSRAVKRKWELNWETLITLFRSETAFIDAFQRIDYSKVQEDDVPFLLLAQDYIAGRPPKDEF